MESETKNCQACKNDFTVEVEDFEFYKKIEVPPPTWCPDCRLQRRAAFYNEVNLYKKKDALSGREVFSGYPEESPIKIIERDDWWSDKFDGTEYAREYDFNRPFFEQLIELSNEVPRASRSVLRLVNSDYSNNASDLKNCYLCFNSDRAEDTHYCVMVNDMTSSLDSFQSSFCQLSYGVFNSGGCYKSFFGHSNQDCQNIWFSRNCEDCTDCFGCVDLKHKKYHIFNKPYSKEEYFKKIEEFNTGSYEVFNELQKKAEDLWLKYPARYMSGVLNLNVSGEYIYNCKNARRCFQVLDSENMAYSQNVVRSTKDSMDYTTWGDNAELIYECLQCGENVQNLKFCFNSWPSCQDLEYSMECHSSSNLFGCIGLKRKEYCIFNKQYTKEEYKELVPKIRKHMDDMPYTDKKGRVYKYGEFFPIEMAGLGYNETIADAYLPLTKDEALKRGFAWKDPVKKEFKVTLEASNIPDDIKDVDESILKEVLGCINCDEPFKLIPFELNFLQTNKIPIPRECFPCRHKGRQRWRNPVKLSKARCQCAGKESDNKTYINNSQSHEHGIDEHCPNEFETTYPPDSKNIVYCEQCYQQEVV